MRKFVVKKALITMYLLIVMMTLIGCDSLFETTTTKDTTIAIIINNDDIETTYQAELGEQVSVGVLYKQGYYLEGYYDQVTKGTKYFDDQGLSTSVWQENYPTTLYPRWGQLSDLSFSDYGVGPYEGPRYAGQSDVVLISTIEGAFLNGVLGNLNNNLELSITLKLKVTSSVIIGIIVEAADGNNSSSETYDTYTIVPSIYDEYALYSFTMTVSASMVKNGEMYITFAPDRDGSIGGNYYIKEFSISAVFVS